MLGAPLEENIRGGNAASGNRLELNGQFVVRPSPSDPGSFLPCVDGPDKQTVVLDPRAVVRNAYNQVIYQPKMYRLAPWVKDWLADNPHWLEGYEGPADV